MNAENCRIFILPPGRTGLSLPSAIISDAGPDFGAGQVADYGDFTDAGETAWAEILSQVAGLGGDAFIKARNGRLKPIATKAIPRHPVLNVEGDALYRHLQSLSGHVFGPSRSALRGWEEKA